MITDFMQKLINERRGFYQIYKQFPISLVLGTKEFAEFQADPYVANIFEKYPSPFMYNGLGNLSEMKVYLSGYESSTAMFWNVVATLKYIELKPYEDFADLTFENIELSEDQIAYLPVLMREWQTPNATQAAQHAMKMERHNTLNDSREGQYAANSMVERRKNDVAWQVQYDKEKTDFNKGSKEAKEAQEKKEDAEKKDANK